LIFSLLADIDISIDIIIDIIAISLLPYADTLYAFIFISFLSLRHDYYAAIFIYAFLSRFRFDTPADYFSAIIYAC
jgi:hypothetical protein